MLYIVKLLLNLVSFIVTSYYIVLLIISRKKVLKHSLAPLFLFLIVILYLSLILQVYYAIISNFSTEETSIVMLFAIPPLTANFYHLLLKDEIN